MRLCHRTSWESAEAILRNGFRDGRGNYLTNRSWPGVWLSNIPKGDTLLKVSIAVSRIADYEWIEEGKPYREWVMGLYRLKAY